MSRCRCCDKVLNTVELTSESLKDEGLCWTCNSAAFSKYNIQDKDYSFGWMDSFEWYNSSSPRKLSE